MYRPAPRPLMLVFPTRAVPLKDDSASAPQDQTNENFARLLRGLTIAVGNRRNRILLYQFLAAENQGAAAGFMSRMRSTHSPAKTSEVSRSFASAARA